MAEIVFTDGVFAVNKPANWTSNDVIQFLKRRYHFQKIGYAGTLDPLATGVLLVGVEHQTKHLQQLSKVPKTYHFIMKFNELTDSLDASGKLLQTDCVEVQALALKQVLTHFKQQRTYLQQIPAFSAKKVAGRKLYEYARLNLTVPVVSKVVKINDIQLLAFHYPYSLVMVDCESGFFVRAFALDCARQLGTIATVYMIKRVRCGRFSLSDCLELNFKEWFTY